MRDDTQGIGTLTYVDEDGRFGALGHGISDVDTGELFKYCRRKSFMMPRFWESGKEKKEIRENFPADPIRRR